MEMQQTLTDAEQARYDAALAFAVKKHGGQFRIGGEPYVIHPIAAAEIVRRWGHGMDVQIAALFHDLLEDTDAAEEEILSLGGEAVLTAVKLLTKRDGYVMAEYIDGIRRNEIAFAVKAADRLHNLQSAVCTSESFRRQYIAESRAWYLDFSPEIPPAVEALERSLSE